VPRAALVTQEQTSDAFVVVHYPAMLRAAFLLTGDEGLAQDLAQETSIRIIQKWSKVAAADDPHLYTRRLLLNVFLAGRRRRWHDEIPQAELPEPAVTDELDAVAARDALRRALLALPPRQRAAVVLRHYEQLSEAQTAALLGCSVGNVKSLASRGLQRLRLADLDEMGTR
jgi:RNA polymerase sigma-70 factor (sigma-E family)